MDCGLAFQNCILANRAGIVVLLGLASFSWLSIQIRSEYKRQHAVSFIYLFPIGWLPTKQQAFLIVHSGTEPIFNARIMLFEMDDRYMNRALTPEEIQKTTAVLNFPEVDPPPGGGQLPSFAWTPTSPEHGEYQIQLSYRSGMVLEHLLIEHLAGDKWAYAMRVGIPNTSTNLIECQDSGFPKGPWFKTGLKPCQTGRLPHVVN